MYCNLSEISHFLAVFNNASHLNLQLCVAG